MQGMIKSSASWGYLAINAVIASMCILHMSWQEWVIRNHLIPSNIYRYLWKKSHTEFLVCDSGWSVWTMWTSVHLHLDTHDDVIKWKHFPRYWPFVRGIHRSPVNSPHKGQWRGALMFSLICLGISDWVNTRKAGDLRRYPAHYDVIVMLMTVEYQQKLKRALALKTLNID